MDVVALGELLIDFTCQSTDCDGYPSMQAHPGGAPVNYLAALAKFGMKTAQYGKVGKDAFGALLKDYMKKVGVSTQGILEDPNFFTTLAFVTLDPNGDRSFSFARKPGADTQISFEELDLSLIDQARVFHFGTLSLTDEPARTATQKAIAYAKNQGKLISCDPNLRPPLWSSTQLCRTQLLWAISQADVLKISDNEVEFLFGMQPAEGADHIMNTYNTKLVFVTCGPEGCYFRNKNAAGFVAAPTGVQVVDTTGAGDIFGGSAMYKLLQEKTAPEELTQAQLEKITKFACTAATLSTTASGGASSVPNLEQIEAYL